MSKERTFDARSYRDRVNRLAPRSKTLLMCFRAFWTGGLICCLGQLITDAGLLWLGLDEKGSAALCAVTLIFIAQALTALGCFDVIASYAGAGTVVPITGFANSIAAPAIEFRSEGLIMGMGAKLFTIAGPVLVYGIGASVIAGLISLLFIAI